MANPIDLRRMRHLVAAVDEGSLTSAAAHLGLTQPALSTSVKSLERELGVTLLRAIAPACGDALCRDAPRLPRSSRASSMRPIRLEQLRGTEAISVSIGSGPSEATRLLPIALIRLRAHASRSPRPRRVRAERIADAARGQRRARVRPVVGARSQSAHADLEHQTLYVDMPSSSPVGHPLARSRSLTARRPAAPWPWVLARRRELERKALDQLFTDAGLPPIEPE